MVHDTNRIFCSIWPAGINTSAPGTVQWAGGMINWNDPDYKAAGHFYALVSSVSVTCSDSSTEPVNTTSYIYGSNSSASTPSVAFSNESTVNSARASASLDGNWFVWTISYALAFSALGAALF